MEDFTNQIKELGEYLQLAIDFSRIETERDIFVNPNFSEELINLDV